MYIGKVKWKERSAFAVRKRSSAKIREERLPRDFTDSSQASSGMRGVLSVSGGSSRRGGNNQKKKL
jgi:hypothetical protein